jgi:hypothetical protein
MNRKHGDRYGVRRTENARGKLDKFKDMSHST